MPETLEMILAATPFTYSVTLALVLWASLIVRTMTDSTQMALLLAPFIGFGALAGVYFFREYEIVVSSDRESNIIATAAGGMCITMLIMLVFGRICRHISDKQKTGLEDRIDPTLKDGEPTAWQPGSR
jgi:hypothetical protein